jgi:hypothetical protein
MKGLELSERYFHEIGLPMLTSRFPDDIRRIACGLVGDGSECFGFDDKLSRDHDWGPGFCLWLTKGDMAIFGDELRSEYERLPRSFAGHGPRWTSTWGKDRIGVFEIGKFYRRFIGFEQAPEHLEDWLLIPEQALAAATNGVVFHDPLGEFSDIRHRLQLFYPEDVRLKKMAARCMSIAQAGQYNLKRCLQRGEHLAAHYAETKFCADAISLCFLLNRRYTPFYKWMHRALSGLPRLGDFMHARTASLVRCEDGEEKIALVEEICAELVAELVGESLTDSSSDFLLDHGPMIQSRIKDGRLRERNVWVG